MLFKITKIKKTQNLINNIKIKAGITNSNKNTKQ